MEGWIKLHRKILDHWICKDVNYFSAWIDILFQVNFEDNKVLIDGELIDCKRGQSLLSLASWAKLFGKNWTIQKVRTFFELLKNDSMIEIEGLRKTTRLTVCNYDTYQDKQQTKNTQKTRKKHTDNTQITTIKEEERKECKEDLETRANLFGESLKQFITPENKEEVIKFWNYWTEPNKSKTKLRFELEKTWDTKKRLVTWFANAKNLKK